MTFRATARPAQKLIGVCDGGLPDEKKWIEASRQEILRQTAQKRRTRARDCARSYALALQEIADKQGHS